MKWIDFKRDLMTRDVNVTLMLSDFAGFGFSSKCFDVESSFFLASDAHI